MKREQDALYQLYSKKTSREGSRVASYESWIQQRQKPARDEQHERSIDQIKPKVAIAQHWQFALTSVRRDSSRRGRPFFFQSWPSPMFRSSCYRTHLLLPPPDVPQANLLLLEWGNATSYFTTLGATWSPLDWMKTTLVLLSKLTMFMAFWSWVGFLFRDFISRFNLQGMKVGSCEIIEYLNLSEKSRFGQITACQIGITFDICAHCYSIFWFSVVPSNPRCWDVRFLFHRNSSCWCEILWRDDSLSYDSTLQKHWYLESWYYYYSVLLVTKFSMVVVVSSHLVITTLFLYVAPFEWSDLGESTETTPATDFLMKELNCWNRRSNPRPMN